MRTDTDRIEWTQRNRHGYWHDAKTGHWVCMRGRKFNTVREAIDAMMDSVREIDAG